MCADEIKWSQLVYIFCYYTIEIMQDTPYTPQTHLYHRIQYPTITFTFTQLQMLLCPSTITNLNPACHMVPGFLLCQLKLCEISPSARTVEICVNHLSLLKSHFHAKPRARLAWGGSAQFPSFWGTWNNPALTGLMNVILSEAPTVPAPSGSASIFIDASKCFRRVPANVRFTGPHNYSAAEDEMYEWVYAT